ELLVVADRAPSLPSMPTERIRFLAWSPEVEASALAEVDVGIMPLPDSEWARGKCSFKMLQYMSCAAAVIVSPVGMNAEVLSQGEIGHAAETADQWISALEELARDPAQARRMGEAGRTLILERYDLPIVSRQIAAAFADLTS